MRERGGDGEGESSEASSLLSYTRRYVSLVDIGHVCQFGLREPMHLCACVSEEGGDGEHKRGSEGRGSTKYDTQKHKCQFRHSISKPVTLFALLFRARSLH
jgi:hypothetical protein